jgi:hypothetical protein
VKRTVGREQYYTEPGLARRCVAYADAVRPLSDFGLVVEPSAGTGAFLAHLPPDRRVGLDVAPGHPEVRTADFLSWHPPDGAGAVLTIGNPPFGQRGALAVRFLAHACGFSDTVAFVLPRSFNKWTFANRVDPWFGLAGSFDCDGFVDAVGRPVSVRTVFQVWQRLPGPRAVEAPAGSHPDFALRHAHLSRVSTDELARLRRDHAFTVPQVGADFRPREVADVTRGSHWFVRPLAAGVRERFERLDFSFLAGMNTAHTSLSRSDIVAAYVAAGDDPA